MQEKIQKISPIKQRILQFVDTLGISKRDFYAQTGISRGTIESPTGITEDTITKIFATYASLSPAWVVTGAGIMLINPNEDYKNANPDANPNANLSNDKDKNADVNVELSEKNSDINIEKALSKVERVQVSFPGILGNEEALSVPFYDLPVSAGSLGILEGDTFSTTPPTGHIQIPAFRGCEAAFPIVGISMEPLVCSGDWIGIKSIENLSRSWDFIQTGVIYLIITREDRMIKFIDKTDDDDFIICKSPNYNAFKVHKGDIINIYRIKAIARGL